MQAGQLHILPDDDYCPESNEVYRAYNRGTHENGKTGDASQS